MESIKERINGLYTELSMKHREITDIKLKIDTLERDMYEVCSHSWEAEPRTYGDHLQYRCSKCFLNKVQI